MKKMNDYEKAVRISLILKGMSMTDLAGELKISKAYLYDIVHGNRKALAIKQRIDAFLNIEDGDSLALPKSEWQTLEEYQKRIVEQAREFVLFDTPAMVVSSESCL